jgi:hypothetical protein
MAYTFTMEEFTRIDGAIEGSCAFWACKLLGQTSRQDNTAEAIALALIDEAVTGRTTWQVSFTPYYPYLNALSDRAKRNWARSNSSTGLAMSVSRNGERGFQVLRPRSPSSAAKQTRRTNAYCPATVTGTLWISSGTCVTVRFLSFGGKKYNVPSAGNLRARTE